MKASIAECIIATSYKQGYWSRGKNKTNIKYCFLKQKISVTKLKKRTFEKKKYSE